MFYYLKLEPLYASIHWTPHTHLHVTPVLTATEESRRRAWMVSLLPLYIGFLPEGNRYCLCLKHWGREASLPVSYLLPLPPPHFFLSPCGCCLFLLESSEASLSSVKYQAPTLLALALCKSAGLTVSAFCRGARGHTVQPSIQARSCLIYAGLYFDVTPLKSGVAAYADCEL